MKTRGSGLIEHAHGRSENVRKKVNAAQHLIEKEVEANEGLYILNGGRLSEAEFCRRANINQVTLLRKAHRLTTKVQIEVFLRDIRKRIARGRRSVRKAVTERVDAWKDRYSAIATEFHIHKLQAIAKDEALTNKDARIAELEAENHRLEREVSDGKVVSIRGAKKKH